MAGGTQVTDMTGKKCGRLTVLRRYGFYGKTTLAAWLCRCDCGVEKVVSGSNLRTGRTASCGCLRQEAIETRFTTHGLSKTATYARWGSMIARCTNPRVPAFARYGARGIKVCDRWRVFENFVADMGMAPRNLTIERIDNDGDYEPSNCRWATRKEQANNTRSNVYYETSHGKLSMAEIAVVAGIGYAAVQRRVESGLRGDQLIAKNKRPRRKCTTS